MKKDKINIVTKDDFKLVGVYQKFSDSEKGIILAHETQVVEMILEFFRLNF